MILMMWSTQQDRTHRGMLDAFLRWMGKHRNCRFGIMSTASGTSESTRSAHKSSSVRFQFLGHMWSKGDNGLLRLTHRIPENALNHQ